MPTPMLTLILATALAQATDDRAKDGASLDSEAAKARAAERLAFMKKSVAIYELELATEPQAVQLKSPTKAMLEPEPLLRWSNIHGDEDGTLFVWTAVRCPVAIAQVFSTDNGRLWLHEFQSLSTGPFMLKEDGQTRWTPEKPGVSLKALADAPIPAKTAAQRSSQMHAMSQRFAASDDYGNNGNLWQLRLLSRPVYRYAKGEAKNAVKTPLNDELIDAAVFAYVVGTDPEMLLLFEARRGGLESAWHYALAPMTCFALTATLDGKAIWSCPFRGAPYNRAETFFSREYWP